MHSSGVYNSTCFFQVPNLRLQGTGTGRIFERLQCILQLESLNFWEFSVLSRWWNIRIQAPRKLLEPGGQHFLALFKLPDPGTNIYIQSLLNFPTWGAHRRSKLPPHPMVSPSGITLIATFDYAIFNLDPEVNGKSRPDQTIVRPFSTQPKSKVVIVAFLLVCILF